jgi:hypothetical protein
MSIAADMAAYVELWDTTGDFQTFATAIGGMFGQVEGFAEDTDTTIGWQQLWDVDLAAGAGLAWLAQFAGERVPTGSTDAQARSLIEAAPNQDRGTPLAIVNAVKQVLTGSQTVGFAERQKPDASEDDDALTVFTYAHETPDPNAVLAALRRTVPGDINLSYSTFAGPTWAALQTAAGNGSWTNLYSHYGAGSWATIEGAAPGYIIY